MRSPERHRFGDLLDYLSILRFTLLERQLQAYFVILSTALLNGGDQRSRLNAATCIEFGSERMVAAFVHQRLLDVDDGRDTRHRTCPGIGVEVVGVRAGNVTMIDVSHHPH